MKNNKEISKPLSIRKKSAEISIAQAINSISVQNELPFFILEDILFKFYTEIKQGAEQERKSDEKLYNEQIAESQKQKEKEMMEDGESNSKSDT